MKTRTIADPKPNRNAPCTCGSGDKFKKCCGSSEKHNERVTAEKEAWEKHCREREERRRQEAEEHAANPNRRRRSPRMASMLAVTALLAMSGGYDSH